MEILYTMKTRFTLSEYKRFSWAVIFRRKGIVIALAVFEILLFAIGLAISEYIYVGIAVLYPFVFWILQNRQIKRIYKSNTLMNDAEVGYEFSEQFLSSDDPSGKSKVDYDKLHEIIETKTNMYLMISENQGFMLKKSEMPEGLEAFLREKALRINKRAKANK